MLKGARTLVERALKTAPPKPPSTSDLTADPAVEAVNLAVTELTAALVLLLLIHALLTASRSGLFVFGTVTFSFSRYPRSPSIAGRASQITQYWAVFAWPWSSRVLW